ncbi:aromatic amino acid lyase [Georgenia muralis]
MATVTITESPMTVEELLAVVDGARVELDERVRARIAASRAVVDRALEARDVVYGLTTQVGHGKDTRLTEEQIRDEQLFLVMSHSGGIGAPLPTDVVRAALAVRLNGIARGGSGAGVPVAEILAAMLNARVHPVVPETSSVGAGDLGQMASVAQVAVGLGRAEYRGEVLPGGEALRRAGISPLVLGGKDGLALISANAVSVGHAALVVTRAARTAETADVAAALSMEATGANVSVLHPAVGRAHGIPGQVDAADHLREVLAGSGLTAPGGARSVQDPLSFRVVPQVHGALREYVAAARHAVATELNAAADNPLAAPAEGALISNGNFHPMVLAIGFDALRIALAHVGQLSERRMAQLWGAFFRQMAGGPPPRQPVYGLQLRYTAAALLPELLQLAAPATLGTPPLDLDVEDHATGAPLTVHRTDEALAVLEDLLAIELLMAHDVLAQAAAPVTGKGTATVLATVTEAVGAAEPYADAVHAALRSRYPAVVSPGGAAPQQRPESGRTVERPPGVPESFDVRTVVYLRRGTNPPNLGDAASTALHHAHLAHLAELGRRGIIAANGPLLDQSDATLRGMSVYTVDVAEARRLAEQDPAVRAGRFRVDVARWAVGAGRIAFPEGPVGERVRFEDL